MKSWSFLFLCHCYLLLLLIDKVHSLLILMIIVVIEFNTLCLNMYRYAEPGTITWFM